MELERSEVLIDACPQCRGVWLDRGELDRILDRERRIAAGVQDDDEDFFLEMSGRRAAPARPGPSPAPDDVSAEPPPKGKKGKKKRGLDLLEDLFDF